MRGRWTCLDASRCRPEFEAAILQDLAWLGVEFEHPVRRQSEHMADYGAALDRLEQAGLVYRSYESRTEIARFVDGADATKPWPRDPDGAPLYRGPVLDAGEIARRAAADAPYALRLDMAKAAAGVGPLTFKAVAADDIEAARAVAAAPEAWGDIVLARTIATASMLVRARVRVAALLTAAGAGELCPSRPERAMHRRP